MSTPPSIDLDRLLKLRLVVARFGEMDLAKWWNTKGQLGKLGTAALRRGLRACRCITVAFLLSDEGATSLRVVVQDPTSDAELYRSPTDIPVRLGV